MKTALAFDDVLLVPQYNEIASRSEVDVSVQISKRLRLGIPIISSCMDTVTGVDMAIAMWQLGGIGILPRYNTIAEQVDMYKRACNDSYKFKNGNPFTMKNDVSCAAAIGATGDYMERAYALIGVGVSIICVDVAHGDSKVVVEAVRKLRQNFPEITIISGNVSTGEGAARLIDAGSDAIRVGIGGGSVCTTRIQTGSGLPTLQTIFDCTEYLDRRGYTNAVIADGGIRTGGDLTKSLAAGARAVMLGQLLAATDEAPGEIVIKDGVSFKAYRGMSSYGAQAEWRPEKKDSIVPEGAETILPLKGSVKGVIHELVGGLRSGMTYSNARTLSDLHRDAQWVQITGAGIAENHPHAKKD